MLSIEIHQRNQTWNVMQALRLLVVTVLMTGCITETNRPPPPKPQPKKAAQSYYELGVAYMKKGRNSLAESKLQRSIVTNPTPDAYNALALLYETQHDNALAEETYQQLISTFPDYPRGYLNYHIFLCQYDRFPQIEQLAIQMARRNKEIAAIGQIAAGNCALSKGDVVSAKQHYQQALAYEQYAAGALLPLAEIDLNRGFVTEAKEKIDKVNNYIGYSARSVYLSILANRDLGNHLEARKMMNVLRSRYSNTPEAQAIFR